MLVKLLSHMAGRSLLFIRGIALASLIMSGSASTGLASDPPQYAIAASSHDSSETTTAKKTKRRRLHYPSGTGARADGANNAFARKWINYNINRFRMPTFLPGR
jgi:hypothetical protein